MGNYLRMFLPMRSKYVLLGLSFSCWFMSKRDIIAMSDVLYNVKSTPYESVTSERVSSIIMDWCLFFKQEENLNLPIYSIPI